MTTRKDKTPRERKKQLPGNNAQKERYSIPVEGEMTLVPPVNTYFVDPTVGQLAIVNTERRIRRNGGTLTYDTPEQMIPIIDEFFEYCIGTNSPPLVTSLCLALGFHSRHNLDLYQAKSEFHDIIKRAKLVCEDFAAKGLIMGKNPIGFIFLLKQYGWRDIQETINTIESHEQRIARLIQQNSGGGG